MEWKLRVPGLPWLPRSRRRNAERSTWAIVIPTPFGSRITRIARTKEFSSCPRQERRCFDSRIRPRGPKKRDNRFMNQRLISKHQFVDGNVRPQNANAATQPERGLQSAHRRSGINSAFQEPSRCAAKYSCEGFSSDWTGDSWVASTPALPCIGTMNRSGGRHSFGVPPSGGPDRLQPGLRTVGSWKG